MRTISLFLLLTVGSLENTHGPFARPERGGGHSVAASPSGVLMAWSENDASGRARIHVARLDTGGRIDSPISVLPALTPDRNALAPSVATDGTSFLVVWEEVFGKQQTVCMAVDEKGTPIGAPKAVTPEIAAADNIYEPATVTWLGDEYAVRSDGSIPVRVARDGTLLGQVAGAFPFAVAENGTRVTAEVRRITGFPGRGGIPPTSQSLLAWTAGTRSGVETIGANVPSGYAIAAAGNDFVIVSSGRDRVFYRMTASGALYSVAADVDASIPPRIECSATRCVVAYATRSGDVHGFTFSPEQPYAPQLFVAAASERFEAEPELLILSDSRGLIAYRSGGSDERLATRTLQFGPVKRRSVR
ncbi:MAG TPA: hypothetical protein VEO54_26060 [Thermoanaerobaculia bacterium]|nr:hypothetical protein [Thermoanaerobaculia bacterium]